MLLFFDFEVFLYDWLVVIIDPSNDKEYVFVNDREGLIKFYEKHKSCIWVGYNSRHYDQWILKGIVAGFDPKKVNDFIIKEKHNGYMFSNLMNKVHLVVYDCMPNPPIGLKTLEGFMGSNIKESDVDFNLQRKLTEREIEETIKYCRHDVEQTIEVFLKRKNEFDAHIGLVKSFGLPLTALAKTESRITADILKCKKTDFNDEFDYYFFDTIRLDKYKFVMDWFDNADIDCTNEMKALYEEAYRNFNKATTKKQRAKYRAEMYKYDWQDEEAWKKYFYKRSLTVDVCGVPHTFGWGGLHGAIATPIHRKGLILHVDVNSYYPSILIEYGIVTRASQRPQTYKEIYQHRLELKAKGMKAEQAPYKKVLNALSGAMKDKHNPAYDPRNNNIMCVNGQLMLLDLLEHLEGHCEILQSNTDGIIIQIPDTDEAFYKIDDICAEWEKRCHMGLGLDVINEIYQGDVNNYLWIDENGEVERKGGYVKELSDIDNDLPIVNDALVAYMVHGTPIEETINNCNDLIRFQKIVKLSDKYEHVEHNGKTYNYKSYRVFASRRISDGTIYKRRGDERAKFGNTPEHCFIMNENIEGCTVVKELDKKYYIDFTKKRLNEKFGVAV